MAPFGLHLNDGTFLQQVLLERLRNETTRLTAVKGWGTLAGSPLVPSLDAALQPLVSELTSFLRKANRLLRQAALATTEVRSAWRLPR